MTSKLKAKNRKHRMPKNTYISLILCVLLLVTLFNLYYKPHLTDPEHPLHWWSQLIHPISKTACSVEGFRCPTDAPCDCEKMCVNGKELVSYLVMESDRILVRNEKLSPGFYCLPKGVGECNLATSIHLFSLAGWSCIPINDGIFMNDKQKACKNEEAQDNGLNILWDRKESRAADANIQDYYELHQNELRYHCRCDSKSLEGFPMVSAFPFLCSVDYCLRDILNIFPGMGWDKDTGECVCGPFDHLDPNDKTSPCSQKKSKMENNKWTGRVPCMNETSFVKQALICPSDDSIVSFEVNVFERNPQQFIEYLIYNKLIQ